MKLRIFTAAAVLFILASPLPPAVAADFLPDAIPPQKAGTDGEGGKINLPDERYVAIYSGSTKGTYFYVGSAICAAVEASFSQHHIHCVSLRSQGDASNIELMQQGRAQFIIIQSNTNDDAAEKRIDLPTGRSVMSLHDELGAIVVSKGNKVASVSGLKGKAVNLGPAGTSSRRLWEQLLAANDIALTEIGTIYGAPQDFNPRALCDGNFDAFGLWIGHPTALVAMPIANCGARVIGMQSPGADRLVAQFPYFFAGTIPAGTYPGQDQPLASYGFKATLVADSRVDPDLVYWVVRSVQDNLSLFKARLPALANVDPRAMFEKANFLPFHDGAARYWREVGWLGASEAK